MKTRFLCLCCALAQASVFGTVTPTATRTWNSSVTAGAFNENENWVGGQAPTETEKADIKQSGTLGLSATADGHFEILNVSADGGDLTVNAAFDGGRLIGHNKDWGANMFVNGTSSYWCWWNQTSGIVSNLCALIVGDTAPNSKVTLSGAGTKIYAARDNTRVGSKNSNCTLEVLNGAVFHSGRETVIGYDPPTGAEISNVLIRVAGAGATYEDASQNEDNCTKLPKIGHHNMVLVEDGGVWQNKGNGRSCIAFAARSHHNLFMVTNRATFSTSQNFEVGSAGSDNRFIVEDRSAATVGKYLRIGAAATATNNSVYIGRDCVLLNPNHTAVGYNGAISSRLDVVGGVLTNSQYDVGIGCAAHASRFRLSDGAQFCCLRRFAVGAPLSFDSSSVVATSSDNAMLVEGENTFADVRLTSNFSDAATIGYYGTNNTLTVREGARMSVGSVAGKYNFIVGRTANAVSNRVTITGKGTELTVGAVTKIGCDGSCGNAFRVEDGALATFSKVLVGCANGSSSNLFYVGSGVTMTNCWQLAVGTDAITTPASAVGNGVIISNAFVRNSTQADEVNINSYGTGGYLKVLDGGILSAHQSVTVGGEFNVNSFTDNSGGLIEVRGAGSRIESTQYHLGIGRRGHDNKLLIADGAAYSVAMQMAIGNASLPGTTNNCLHICNSSFTNASSEALWLYNNSKIIWEGSKSTIRICSLRATSEAELEFVADENGLAPFGPVYETYLLDSGWKPTVKKIKVDLTKYIKANGTRRTFTILKSGDNRTCRNLSGTDLSAQSAATIASVNRALKDLIEVTPVDCVKSIEVDMTKSSIKVTARKLGGLMIILR